MESDLERELQYHLDRRTEDLIKTGLDETEARRRARIEFGGLSQTQEETRETWVWRWLDSLVGDVRYSIRSLSKSLTFTLGAGAVLALAIGANLAIFSVVNTVLLQPLAYPDAERIVSVETYWTNTGQASQDVSGPDFLDWQAQNNVFESMAHYAGEEGVAIVVGDRAEFANDMDVSTDFFTVFGQAASAGRLLTDRDVPTGGAPSTVAVVRRQWAESHFGSAEAAIGKTITVYGLPRQIVGVAARGFSYPGVTDIWSPAHESLEPQRLGLPRRRETQGRGGSCAGESPNAGDRRQPGATIPGEPIQDGRLDSAAGSADRRREDHAMAFAGRSERRVAHRLRKHRESSTRAERSQDVRSRCAPRSARAVAV